MSAPRLMLIAALFFIDVRVRAEDKHEGDADCWGKHIPCALQAVEHRRKLQAGDSFTLVMEEGSLIEQRDGKTIQLVDGRFYVELDQPMVFATPYATLSCSGPCKALLERKLAEVSVKALEGDWAVKRLGDKREYVLSAGLQITVGEVETDGVAQMEFPQSLPWGPTVMEWSRMYPFTVELFKSEITRFRKSWKQSVESVSQVHEQAAARALASYETGLAKERARRKAEQKEEAALRELFRKKNDIDP